MSVSDPIWLGLAGHTMRHAAKVNI